MTATQPTVFDPSPLATSVEDATGIPREYYVDQAVYDREIDSIFNKSWLYAGHESQLQQPGCYLTVESGDESVIVARGEDGQLAAFDNVCRHRGSRLVEAGCGQARRLVCPYHQWTYRMDGSLQGAPKMGRDFDRTQYSLKPVHVAAWHGLVFVNLSEAAVAPLDETLQVAEPVIIPFELERAKVAHSITYDVAANWKIMWENGQECYHCSSNHPEFTRTFDLSPESNPTAGGRKSDASEDLRVQVARFVLRPGAVSLTVDGSPASSEPLGAFVDGRERYTVSVSMTPTFAAVCCPDYAVVVYDRPISLTRTAVTVDWLVAGNAEPGTHFDVDNLISVWDATNKQDWELCQRTQSGVLSKRYEPGPLATGEVSVAAFHRIYAAMLDAAQH